MSPQVFDDHKYGELLAEAKPVVIETPEEHERMLNLAESLMDKGALLTVEERRLLELLVLLIEAFEQNVQDEEDGEVEDETLPPHQLLERMLKNRGLEASALVDIFGNPALVRETLTGSRPITRGQAKQLSRLLNVPPRVFLRD